ncbi:MAG: PAS domain-containing protein [Tolypothrix brevis GSE-NOS-MK-07-07A]|jgi:PAS domain S-box-containing protein|nr:PAS domain-containing protein [Tolypothrix brevis GSE-NOS-MK-07-07A]
MQNDNNRNESVSQINVLSNNCPPRQELNEELEARVEERTAELNRMVVELKEEIKKRIEIENQLRSSEQFLQLAMDSIPQLIFWKDRNSLFLGCNQKFASIAGLGLPENIIGKSDYDLPWKKEETEWFRECDRRVMESGVAELHIIEPLKTADGKEGWVDTNKIPLLDAEGNVVGILVTAEDISYAYRQATQRKLVESQLQQQKEFLRTVFDGSENPIFVIDVLKDGDFCYVGWSAATERASGLSSAEVIGKTPESVHGAIEGAEVRRNFVSCQEAAKSISYEECLTFFGEESWWLTTINPLEDSEGRIYRLVGTTFNISDRKRVEIQLKQQAEDLQNTLKELQRTQIQLIQSEKMSGLGQLLAGVAHEINNPVNFIFGNLTFANNYIEDLLRLVQLYEQHYGDPVPEIQELIEDIDLNFLIEDLRKLLKSMKVGAERIREIVLSLRTFSRMDEAEMKKVDIHEGLDSTLMILDHRIKVKPDRIAIEVIKEYANLPLVECYAGQLNQVFMNILANAIDALDESLVNEPEKLTNPQIRICTELLEGDRVKISIADNGLGIPSAVKARLFDPFFTTKAIGKGTGMGLSISYQIISDRHSGSLECISQPGTGAEFMIVIPLCQG